MSSKQETEGIFVGIRLRPLNEREKTSGQEKIFASNNNSVSQTCHGQPIENQTYNYDRVFNENATTAEVYDATARNIVKNVLGGINGCIFAYGQTSSGKTHTMLGGGDQLGVLNMAARDIFAHIEAHPNRDFLMRASFVEIYNENIRDLLSASSDASVAIREDPRRGVYCEAVESMVSTYEGVTHLLNAGISRRAVEATAMNDTSSRSHTIFKLVIESRESNRNGYEGDGAVLVATLNLVDLAGSESVKHTGATGKRAVEGGKINQSLLSLSRVIHALSTPGAHVGYRDSKLTRLLQPSLSGNAKMSIICCITTASAFLEETRSTLQFASRAKLIVTHATVNEVVDDAVLVKRLKRELEELKAVTSEDSVQRMRHLEQRSSHLEEQLSIKEAALEQMKSHYETMSMGRGSDASFESIDTFNGSDRRSSKRQRADGEEDGSAEEKEEGAPTLASIKNALSMMHARRAQAPELPSVVVAAVEAAVEAPVATPAKMEEVKAVPFNPMTLGLRNQLMKELDFKLVARKSKAETSEAAPMEEAKEDENLVANRALTAQVAELQADLASAKEIIESQEARIEEAAAALDQTSQCLEAELQANADLKAAEAEARESLAAKLVAADELVASLQAQLLQATEASMVASNAAGDAVVAELESENEKLQEEVSSLLTQLEQLQATSQEENQQLQNEVTGLLEQLEESHSDSASATALKEVQDQLAEREAACDAASEALDAAKAQLAAVQEELAVVSATVSELQASLESSAESLADSQAELERVQAELASASASLSELQAAQEASAESLAAAQEESTAAQEIIDALEAQNASDLEKIESLEAKIATDAERVAELETETTSQLERIQSLEAEQTAAVEKVEGLESQRATDAETIATLENDLSVTMEKLSALEADRSSEQDKIASVVADRSADEEKMAALEAECASAQEIIESMEADRAADAEKLTALEAEVAAHQEKIQSLEVDRAAAVEKLASIETERAADLERIATLEAARTADQENVAAMEAKLSEVIDQGLLAEEHLEAARDQVTELHGAVAAAEDKVEELNDEMRNLHRAASEQEENLAHANECYNNSQQELFAARAQVAELQASLEQASAQPSVNPEEVETLTAGLAAAKEECECLTEKLVLAQEAEAAATEQVQALNARIEETTTELDELKAQLSVLESEKATLTERVEALEAEVKESATNSAANGDIITELEASLVASLNDQQAAEEELSTLTQSLEETEKEELTQQVDTLQTQLETAEEHLKALKPASPKENNGAGVARMNEFEMNQDTLDATRREMERQVANVQAELGNKEAEVSRLMASLNEVQQRAVVAEQRLASNENSYDANESEGAKKRIAQLQTSVDLLNGEKDSLLLKLQAAERQLKTGEGEASVAVEKMEREVVALNKQIEKLTQEAAHSARLQENANEVKRRLEDTIAQRDAQQQRADGACQRIDALEAQIETLQTKPDASSDDADAADQIFQLRAEKSQLQEDLAELSVRLRKSQEATAQLREQWDQSEPERIALQQQLASLEAERAGLVGELEAAMDNINQLTDALEEATNEAELATERASTATAGIAMEPMEPSVDETVAALESELEQAKTDKEIATLEAEVQREELAGKIAELEEELAQTHEQLEGARSAAASLEAEMQKLGEFKRADASDLQQLHGVVKHQADQVAELIAQLETAQSQLAEAQAGGSAFAAEKASLEQRVSELEGEIESLQQKMQFQAESAAQELEVATNSSYEEVSALQDQLAAKTEELAATSADMERLTAASHSMEQEVAALTAASRAQESQIAELEHELAEVKQAGEEPSEAEEQLQASLAAAKQELLAAREELRAANEHCAVNEDMVASLQEQLEVKEARIVHLDSVKLTKEQMDKIKTMKEERKKFEGDAKMLKKNLHQLTIKFDELKKTSLEHRNNGVGGGPSTDYIISDLRVQLVTTGQQLSQTQDEVKLLKSKLKECSLQLQEYENDHNGIVAVLERYQIDTRGLIALEHSVDEDSSALHGDIADAVAQLGEKLDVAKAAVARREVVKSEKVTELENRLTQVTAEAEEAKVQRVSAEKRMEALKAAAKTARETNGNLTVEIEALTANVASLKAELNAAQRHVATSSDVSSSEVQALEEENIELLKENKDLRVQVSRLKANQAAAPTPVAAAPVSLNPFDVYAPSVANTPDTRSANQPGSCLSGNKRAFGMDISNTVPSSAVKAAGDVTKPLVSAASTAPGTEQEEAVGSTRRTRTKVSKAAKATPQVADEGAECKQS